MIYLRLFEELPNFNCNMQRVLNDDYNPTLYKWEGRWIVSWVNDDGESLIECEGATPEEAILNASRKVTYEIETHYKIN